MHDRQRMVIQCRVSAAECGEHGFDGIRTMHRRSGNPPFLEGNHQVYHVIHDRHQSLFQVRVQSGQFPANRLLEGRVICHRLFSDRDILHQLLRQCPSGVFSRNGKEFAVLQRSQFLLLDMQAILERNLLERLRTFVRRDSLLERLKVQVVQRVLHRFKEL